MANAPSSRTREVKVLIRPWCTSIFECWRRWRKRKVSTCGCCTYGGLSRVSSSLTPFIDTSKSECHAQHRLVKSGQIFYLFVSSIILCTTCFFAWFRLAACFPVGCRKLKRDARTRTQTTRREFPPSRCLRKQRNCVKNKWDNTRLLPAHRNVWLSSWDCRRV